MNKKLNIYHWEFYIEDCDIYVYDKRTGDVLGSIDNYELDEINDILYEHSESDVYDWIDRNINYI